MTTATEALLESYEDMLCLLEKDSGYQVLRRVPEIFPLNRPINPHESAFAIIDLETTGLDYKVDKITEIGIIKGVYNSKDNTTDVLNVYQEFNDPGVSISKEITELTGITNEMVKDKLIDWDYVKKLMKTCKLIICHNAAFDRKFLEQTPLADVFKEKDFGCSKSDVNWAGRGFSCNKLDYLNWRHGYFYDGHRAVNDCWATLNLLIQSNGWKELYANINTPTYEVYADEAPFAQKDKLAFNGFIWNGSNLKKPKAWFKTTKNKEEVVQWLRGNINCRPITVEVTAKNRYSIRG